MYFREVYTFNPYRERKKGFVDFAQVLWLGRAQPFFFSLHVFLPCVAQIKSNPSSSLEARIVLLPGEAPPLFREIGTFGKNRRGLSSPWFDSSELMVSPPNTGI